MFVSHLDYAFFGEMLPISPFTRPLTTFSFLPACLLALAPQLGISFVYYKEICSDSLLLLLLLSILLLFFAWFTQENLEKYVEILI